MDRPWEYYAEINQRKTNTTLAYLYVESKEKKNKLIDIENRSVVARGGVEVGEMDEGSQKT